MGRSAAPVAAAPTYCAPDAAPRVFGATKILRCIFFGFAPRAADIEPRPPSAERNEWHPNVAVKIGDELKSGEDHPVIVSKEHS